MPENCIWSNGALVYSNFQLDLVGINFQNKIRMKNSIKRIYFSFLFLTVFTISAHAASWKLYYTDFGNGGVGFWIVECYDDEGNEVSSTVMGGEWNIPNAINNCCDGSAPAPPSGGTVILRSPSDLDGLNSELTYQVGSISTTVWQMFTLESSGSSEE